jgi:hypothetical protein
MTELLNTMPADLTVGQLLVVVPLMCVALVAVIGATFGLVIHFIDKIWRN